MASSPAYYWDACLFYEVLGDEPVGLEKKEAINELLQDNKDGKNLIITSILTHLEVIPTKLEQKKTGAENQYIALFDGKKFLDIEINRNILMRAREIREFYYRPASESAPAKVMDAADAVHLATASIYQVKAFHTRDNDEKGIKIPLVSLYKWSGHDKLCGKYNLNIISPEHDQKAFDLNPSSPASQGLEHDEPPDASLDLLSGISESAVDVDHSDAMEAAKLALDVDVEPAISPAPVPDKNPGTTNEEPPDDKTTH